MRIPVCPLFFLPSWLASGGIRAAAMTSQRRTAASSSAEVSAHWSGRLRARSRAAAWPANRKFFMRTSARRILEIDRCGVRRCKPIFRRAADRLHRLHSGRSSDPNYLCPAAASQFPKRHARQLHFKSTDPARPGSTFGSNSATLADDRFIRPCGRRLRVPSLGHLSGQ